MKKRNTIVTIDTNDPEFAKRKSLSDWEWLDKATDEEIDFSDIPPLGEDFFRNAIVRMPRVKKMVSIRLDGDVVDWYKGQGPGYQTRINAVLKACMVAALEASSKDVASRNPGPVKSSATSIPSGRKLSVNSKGLPKTAFEASPEATLKTARKSASKTSSKGSLKTTSKATRTRT